MGANNNRQLWSGKLGFTISLAGAAVGLGNIWRFPYLLGQGGGLFFLLYALCMIVLVLPVMFFEIRLGFKIRKNPLSVFDYLIKFHKVPILFKGLAYIGIAILLIALSFYTVVSGWVTYYLYKSLTFGIAFTNEVAVKELWSGLLSSPTEIIKFNLIFIAINWFILRFGIQRGLELANKIMMPSLFILLAAMIGYLVMINGAAVAEACNYLIRMDFSLFNGEIMLDALGQAVFTLAVGAGAIMTYGVYLPKNSQSLLKSSYIIILMQLIMCILIGILVFAIILSKDEALMSSGPAMLFIVMPLLFGGFQYASVFAIIFFIITLFAAITSSLNIAEPMIYMLEQRKNLSRKRAVNIIALIIILTSTILGLSFNIWSGVIILGYSIFDMAVDLVVNILMPLASLLFALLGGWFIEKRYLSNILGVEDNIFIYQYIRLFLRYVFPGALLLIFIF